MSTFTPDGTEWHAHLRQDVSRPTELLDALTALADEVEQLRRAVTEHQTRTAERGPCPPHRQAGP